MSLIHKALMKAEHGGKGKNEIRVVTPEEEMVDNKSDFFSVSFTPRTVILTIVAVAGLIYVIYDNFIASKPPKLKGVPPAAAQLQGAVPAAASPAAVIPAAPAPLTASVPASPEAVVSGVAPGASSSKVEFSRQASDLKAEGERMFLAGQFDAALAKFSEALAESPASPELLTSMGLIYKKKGDMKLSEEYYQSALRNNPDYAEALNNLGVLEIEKGENDKAVVHLKKAISVAGEYADPYFNLGMLMEKEGNLKSAVENYKKFLVYTKSADETLKGKVVARIEDLAMDLEE